MKNPVLMCLLLAGMISCSKKDLISTETPPPFPPQTSSSLVSSDTVTENEELPDGRTYLIRKYWITSVSPVKENSSVTITMNTTNVTKGTVIPYSITGIDTSDLTSGKLAGNFIIGANGKDSITCFIKADNKTEGVENLKITAKTASLSVSITDVSTDIVTVVPAQPVSFKLDTIPYSDMDIVSAGRGANSFYFSSYNISNLPSTSSFETQDDDTRFLWSQLQKGATTFDWSSFDAKIKSCITSGYRFSFGIANVSTFSPDGDGVVTFNGGRSAYPQFVHDAMQAETNKDYLFSSVSGNKIWIPNWNSDAFLSNWEKFLVALAGHINTATVNGVPIKNVIYKVDIRGFGNWGEWHNWDAGRDDPNFPTANKITDASAKRIIDSHINAFPNIQLIGLSDAFGGELSTATGYYLLTAKNNYGYIGWRNDHWGDVTEGTPSNLANNSKTYNGVSFKSLIMSKYLTAPVIGELAGNVTYNGVEYGLLESQVKQYHVSQFSNVNVTTTGGQTAVRAASKAAGYRINIYGGSVTPATTAGGSMQVATNWGNIGVAPAYENWDVWYELRSGSTVVWTGKSSFTPKLFLSGTKAVTDNFTPGVTGTFSLYMIIKDPTGYRKPLMLANKNRQADGSYKLTDVKL